MLVYVGGWISNRMFTSSFPISIGTGGMNMMMMTLKSFFVWMDNLWGRMREDEGRMRG